MHIHTYQYILMLLKRRHYLFISLKLKDKNSTLFLTVVKQYKRLTILERTDLLILTRMLQDSLLGCMVGCVCILIAKGIVMAWGRWH